MKDHKGPINAIVVKSSRYALCTVHVFYDACQLRMAQQCSAVHHADYAAESAPLGKALLGMQVNNFVCCTLQ